MIWGKNKDQEINRVVFMDKEIKLFRSPDVFGSSEFCPFRDGVFDVVLFDPPWGVNMPPWWNKPESLGNNYGNFKSKREIVYFLHKSQREFQRVADRLCMKWGERNLSLWSILGIFVRDGWKEVFRRETGGIKSKTKNYWITMVKTSINSKSLRATVNTKQLRTSNKTP